MTCYTFFVLILLLLTQGGCVRNMADRETRTPSPSTPRKLASHAFGAVHHTYADVYAEPDVQAERLTQCIYGDVVRIEQENHWWYGVKVGPYPALSGWIHKAAVTLLAPDASYIKERHLTTIVIRQDLSQVFVWPSQTVQIVLGTELPFLGESGQWYLVRLPSNDIGRIARAAVQPPASSVPEFEAPPMPAASDTPPLAAPTPTPSAPVRTIHPQPQPAEVASTLRPLIHSKKAPIATPQTLPRQRRHIVITAKRFLGKAYVWGGTTPRGFDCSGLSYFVYKLNGVELPRVAFSQFRHSIGQKIQRKDLEHGDLVFFQTYKRGPSHVGIYIGQNQFIHASPRYGVTTSSLDEPYFRQRYIGAKTIFSTS